MIVLKDSVNGDVLLDPDQVVMAQVTAIRGKGDAVTHHLGVKFANDDSGMFTVVFNSVEAADAAMSVIQASLDIYAEPED